MRMSEREAGARCSPGDRAGRGAKSKWGDLPADSVGGYFHVVVGELAAPDSSHHGLDFLFQRIGDFCLAFVVLINGWRRYALI